MSLRMMKHDGTMKCNCCEGKGNNIAPPNTGATVYALYVIGERLYCSACLKNKRANDRKLRQLNDEINDYFFGIR